MDEFYSLVIDTSIGGVVTGLGHYKNGKLAGSHQQTFLQNNAAAEQLPQLIQTSLDALQIDIPDIQYYMVGQGPGSFTGIRIGLSFLHGVKLGSIKGHPKFLGFSSLQVIANALDTGDSDWILFPSTRTHSYVVKPSDEGVGSQDVQLVVHGEFLAKLALASKQVHVLGDLHIDENIREKFKSRLQLLDKNHAAKILISYMLNWVIDHGTGSFESIVPHAVYKRLSTVEEKMARS